jgi:hypothetical protein
LIAIVARSQEPLAGAIELMLAHDFSQLPVSTSNFSLKGA